VSEVRRVSVVTDEEFFKLTVCPYCNSHVGHNGMDVHEVLIHPEKRSRFHTDEYKQWSAEQAKTKSKRKKS